MEQQTRLFAYGALKRGTIVHDQLCRGVIDVAPARVWGRLFEMSTGYPALQVPAESIFAKATEDAERDQAEYMKARFWDSEFRVRGRWRPVLGHVITFDDYQEALPPLDSWEDAAPGSSGVYERALIAVEPEDSAPTIAWAYVVPRLPMRSREIVTCDWTLPMGLAS